MGQGRGESEGPGGLTAIGYTQTKEVGRRNGLASHVLILFQASRQAQIGRHCRSGQRSQYFP